MTTTAVVVPKKYKLHFHNKITLLLWGAVMAHIGLLIIVALYYGLFETTGYMNNWWHHAVSNADLRHNIRDVGEGVLGGFLAKGIRWNHFTKSHQKAGRIFDALHQKLKIPAWIAALLATAIIFAATFSLGTWILHTLAVHSSTPNPSGSIWSRTTTLWNSNWDKKALGFVCAFAATRPMHAIFDDIQGYFTGRRVTLGKKPHFWYPKPFKNRYQYLTDNQYKVRQYSPWTSFLMRFAFLAGVVAAGCGYYVLTYVA